MASCGQMVEGNIVSFACDLDRDHEGPCRAVENARSVRERKRWEEDKRHAESGLGEFQGRAETTAERYTENPTPVPGPQAPPPAVPEAEGDVEVDEDQMGPVVVEEKTDGSLLFRPATSAEAKVAGIPNFRKGVQGCGACKQGDHAHCQFIEDNVGAVDAQDFIDCYCQCFKASPGMHEVARQQFEEWQDARETTYDVSSLAEGEGRPESYRWDGGEVGDQGAEGSSVGFAFGPLAAGPTKQREGDQPLPTPTQGEYVQDRIIAKVQALVEKGTLDPLHAQHIIATMEESKEVGTQRYGTPLQTFNGRDTLQDAAEEARDLFVYLSSLAQAREAERGVLVKAVTQALMSAYNAQGPTSWVEVEVQDAAAIAVDTILNATGGM